MKKISTSALDFDTLIKICKINTLNIGFKTIILGKTYGDYPIVLVTPKELNPNLKNVLVVSGAHGEEIGGPWGVASFLASIPKDILRYINISFIPCANPTGFINNRRYNIKDEITNIFIDPKKPKKLDLQSLEAKIIFKHKDLIQKLSSDLMVTLHENIDQSEFYIYQNCYKKEIEDEKNDIRDILINAMLKRFKKRKDGKYTDYPLVDNQDEYVITDGVISNSHDGSFEDAIVRYFDGNMSIVTETPIKNNSLEDRINTNCDIIQSVVGYYSLSTDGAEIINVPTVNQDTCNSCGASSLFSILRYYGINDISEEKLRRQCKCSDDGIEPEDIVRVAKEYGMKARYFRNATIDNLFSYLDNHIPCICAIVAWCSDKTKMDYNLDEDGHYVVAIGRSKTRIYFEDPVLKNYRGFLDINEFKRRWHDIDGKNIFIPISGEFCDKSEVCEKTLPIKRIA